MLAAQPRLGDNTMPNRIVVHPGDKLVSPVRIVSGDIVHLDVEKGIIEYPYTLESNKTIMVFTDGPVNIHREGDVRVYSYHPTRR
jgi:hypothetical protein